MTSPKPHRIFAPKPVGPEYARVSHVERRRGERRKAGYPGPGRALYVPRSIWVESIAWMKYYGSYRSEALVFWGGCVTACGSVIVTTLLTFDHPPGGGVKPTDDEARRLVRALSSHDLKLVAQVHSHGGSWVDHSHGDNEHPASYHDGYWSLVVPDFGRGAPEPEDCGVHEFHQAPGRFVRLASTEVKARVRLDESFLLLSDRQDRQPPKPPQEVKPWYQRIWTFLRKKPKSTG